MYNGSLIVPGPVCESGCVNVKRAPSGTPVCPPLKRLLKRLGKKLHIFLKTTAMSASRHDSEACKTTKITERSAFRRCNSYF